MLRLFDSCPEIADNPSNMLIRNLKVSGVLSFGAKGIDLEMRPLNVLIGANGSGKSNFIEIINLLRYMPARLDSPIMTSGGMSEWLYGGAGGFNIEPPLVHIEAVVTKEVSALRHSIVLRGNGDFLTVDDETIEEAKLRSGEKEPWWYYRMHGGEGLLHESTIFHDREEVRTIKRETMHILFPALIAKVVAATVKVLPQAVQCLNKKHARLVL
jgi:predicted ATPase